MQNPSALIIRELGLCAYQPIHQRMQAFTDQRDANTADELWFCEHLPVFTQGQAGKAEHILTTQHDIPIIQSDRGGQVTYHGPGQQMMYVLLNLKRHQLSVRQLVSHLENTIIDVLAQKQITAYAKADAPGVYVQLDGQDAKLCSLGLRIRRGHSFHGLALNVNMDLSPFNYINPCGYAKMRMTSCAELNAYDNMPVVRNLLIKAFTKLLAIQQTTVIEGFDE